MVSKHFFQYCSRSSIFIGSYDKPKYSSNVKQLFAPITENSFRIDPSNIIALAAIHTLFFIIIGFVIYSKKSESVLCVHEYILVNAEMETSFLIVIPPLPSSTQ